MTGVGRWWDWWAVYYLFLEIAWKRRDAQIPNWTRFWDEMGGVEENRWCSQKSDLMGGRWAEQAKAVSLHSTNLRWVSAHKIKRSGAIIPSYLQIFDPWFSCFLPARRGDRTVHHTESLGGEERFNFLKRFACSLEEERCRETIAFGFQVQVCPKPQVQIRPDFSTTNLLICLPVPPLHLLQSLPAHETR